MSGSRFKDGATTRVIKAPWWKDGDEVTIKRFTFGEIQRIDSVLINARASQVVSKNGDNEDPQFQTLFDIYGTTMLKLELGIMGWNFKDANGDPVPVTRRNIHNLNDDDGKFILDQIEKLNPDNWVSDNIVLQAEERVEQIATHLEELKGMEDVDDHTINIQEMNLVAARERLVELQEKQAQQRELFPENKESAHGQG